MGNTKFKAGEYVRVKKVNKRQRTGNSAGWMDHLMGKIVKITEVYDNCVGVYDKEHNHTWAFELDQVEKAKSVIVIYQKENQTIALNKVTGKKAVARCHPDDEFDFEVGAKLAFQRLTGSEVDEKEDSLEEGAKSLKKVVDSLVTEGFTRKEAIDISLRMAKEMARGGK